ncbi:immunoglobulin I-set domain protein [Trichuris suis]|nr:immunoglobulin I-set domain protein [Trichuris suis]
MNLILQELIDETEPSGQGARLLVALIYLPEACSLTVCVLQAKDLARSDSNSFPVDSSVITWLVQADGEIEKRSTAVKYGSISPTYNEAFTFYVDPEDIFNTSLVLAVVARPFVSQSPFEARNAMDPFIEQTPSILNKPDGSVLFECMVSANPEPEVKWFFKDQELTNSDRYTIKKRKMVGKYACTLQIKQPQNSDQGIYKVVATNSRGKAEKEQSYVMLCTADSMYK